MEKYRYIIIDDEPLSHLTVSHRFKNYPNYTCAATFYNPVEALKFLQENDIDLIFLDIEMPEMDGFQFLEALKKRIFVVILTAYSERYSHEAHDFYDRDLVFFSNKAQLLYYFPKIIARFEKLYAEKEIINRVEQLSKNEPHTFPRMVNNKSILFTDIRIIMVIGHHTVLKMRTGEEHIFRMTFRELKNFLPANLFFHIKRNIIINIIYVTAFNDTTICLDEEHFVISLKINKNIISDLRTALQELRP
jgi:DNA-binding LytR/AlgR family response regulator